MITPQTAYPTEPECLIVLVDLRGPDAKQRLGRQLDAWRGFARAERLSEDCVVLVIRPGGAGQGAR
jgi:hypothetical protein